MLRIQPAFASVGRPAGGPVPPIGLALPGNPESRLFVLARMGTGVAGLAALSLSVPFGGGGGGPILFLLCAAPLLAAAIASRPQGRDPSHLVTGAASGALASHALAGLGTPAWPLIGLLLLEPVSELLSGRQRAALCGLAGTAGALAVAAVSWRAGSIDSDPTGPIAAALLTFQTLAYAAAVAVARAQGRAAAPVPAARSDETVPVGVIGDLVTWHDACGDVIRASVKAESMLGVAPRALHGSGYMARVHVADRPLFLKTLSDAAHGSGPVRAEIRVQAEPSLGEGCPNPTGTTVFVEMHAHRLAGGGEAGEPIVVAFTRDVSAERTRAQELETARAEAERANDLKGKFLATVSHELRTPLNAIIGFSELLAADHPFLITEDRRREYASIIRGSGHHLLELVNTLLDMSKIETGNFNFEPEPFNLRDLATSACDLIQLKADAAGVRIDRKLASGLPEIVADRRACRQILLNLVSNAVKFTPAGGVVSVELSRAGELMALTVADTGIGIPESDLPRIGDPFFQSGDVHRRDNEGTGLGLSVVRGLVGLHGGRMSIESGEGAGTTVTVTLPLRADPTCAAGKPAVLHVMPRVAARERERRSA